MADLHLNSIEKRFGSLSAINNLSLSVEDGEFISLVGPSGCGKSTLLRMIAGLEPISSGDLMIGGERMNDVSPQKRDMSMVFQSYALFPHMSVRRNIDFGPRVRGESNEAAEQGVRRAADMLNLGDYLDRKPAQLSGGQRQRVAMGRAVVRDPKAFLFDEPLSNLDAKLRVQMRTEIKNLHRKLGTTAIYVTHDQIEAMTMADRIAVMNKGHIEQVGAPLELYDSPDNMFVAGFIGSPAMNFFRARYTADDNGFHATLADGSVLPVTDCGAINDESITVGIRPEAFVHDEAGPLTATAEVIEPTGPEIHISGSLADAKVSVVFRERIVPKPDEKLRLSVSPDQVHIFDEHGNAKKRTINN